MPDAAVDLEALYRKYAPVAHRRACRLLGNEADARELVHDVFTSLLERPEQFRGESSLTTFMYQVVTHACLNRLRNQRTRAALLQLRGNDALAPVAASPEISATLRSALASMPEELATVTVYHHGEGLTHDDIARILECSPRHVGDLLERASRYLQKGARRV